MESDVSQLAKHIFFLVLLEFCNSQNRSFSRGNGSQRVSIWKEYPIVTNVVQAQDPNSFSLLFLILPSTCAAWSKFIFFLLFISFFKNHSINLFSLQFIECTHYWNPGSIYPLSWQIANCRKYKNYNLILKWCYPKALGKILATRS